MPLSTKRHYHSFKLNSLQREQHRDGPARQMIVGAGRRSRYDPRGITAVLDEMDGAYDGRHTQACHEPDFSSFLSMKTVGGG